MNAILRDASGKMHHGILFDPPLTFNHNYNKILKSDWFSTALISALIGQFNRTVRIMPT